MRGGDIVGAVVVVIRPAGVWEREGGRYIEYGVVEDCAVEEVVTGDHGREEAIELRDRLRLYNAGIGGISSVEVRGRETDGLRGDCLIVPLRSSSTLVELFHVGRLLNVVLVSAFLEGELSGVRLLLYLWEGRSGVVGVGGWPPLKKWNTDDRWRRVRDGSEEGIREREGLLDGIGVTLPGDGDFVPDPAALSLRAILRKGEIDREIVFELLGERPFFSPLGGVARYPFLDTDVTADWLEPPELRAESLPCRKNRRRLSISVSVLAIRSFKLRQRCVHSACRRKHSPFFVTRSWTPLSIMDKTFVVAGM